MHDSRTKLPTRNAQGIKGEIKTLVDALKNMAALGYESIYFGTSSISSEAFEVQCE